MYLTLTVVKSLEKEFGFEKKSKHWFEFQSFFLLFTLFQLERVSRNMKEMF